MGSIGWKRFKFFDEERFRDTPFPEGVTAACAGPDDDIWLACADGLMVCMDRELAIRTTFTAFRGKVHFLDFSKGKLVAIGEEADGLKSLSLKCWDLNGLRSGTTPPVLAATKIFAASKLPEGTLQAASSYIQEWPQVIVTLGTSTGAVHIYKGDAVKGKLTAPFAVAYVLQGAQGAGGGVTALHFAGTGPALHLFALSATSLVGLSVVTGQPLLEDACGASPGCSTVTRSGELLVAGPDAVNFYTAEEGRKAAVAIKGSKHALIAFKHYVAAAVPDDSAAADAAAGGGTVLRVFDVANKVIAATAAVDPPVRWVVGGANAVLGVDASGAAVRFTERSLEHRLESLFRSRSFQLALRIAHAEGVSPKTLAEVRRYFGDFLYGKRDYDGAAVQYAATVGILEPSYVIQRFLDAQRVHNLTSYLEAVHEAGIATADHTTLLLNCYTKLRDVAKIDAFVQGAGTSGPVKFDASAAVAVLHSSGYPEHAVYVALAAGHTDEYLTILLEECKRYDEALDYIRGLGRKKAAAALLHFGKLLLQGDPVSTTALLMELCLPSQPDLYYAPSMDDLSLDNNKPSGGANSSDAATAAATAAEDALFVANLADFTHLYTERPDDLRYACVTILAMGHPDLPSRQTLYHTLLDLYLGGSRSPPGTASTAAGASNDHSNGRTGPTTSSATAIGQSTNGGGKSGQDEAMDLLRRGWAPGQEPAYDVDRALTTCRLYSFHQGLVFLYTNRRDYREAAAVLAEARDWPALLQLCETHGSAATGGDPEVWHVALNRLSSPAAGPGADPALRELLARIESDGVMPPLAVLQVLARNPHLRLELARDYVIRALQAENRAIAADLEEVERLKEEVEKAESVAKRLTTEPIVFQSSRDSQTGAPLELPSVHFLCGHSFNLRTLGDGADRQECPLCATEHRRVRELQRSYRASASDTDGFFRQLKAAPDGFGLVAEYFGKGMLNNTSVTTRQ